LSTGSEQDLPLGSKNSTGNMSKGYQKKVIFRDDRICDLCNSSELGDEFHYLLQCSYFSNERCKMFPYDVYTRPNTDKFKDLLCTDDYITLVKPARFCKIILSVIN